MRLNASAIEGVRALIATRLGLDFEKKLGDLGSRLRVALSRAGDADLKTYLDRLAALPDGSAELLRLAGHLVIGETYFFRDPACFKALELHVLPALIAARRAAMIHRLHIWSAGCATGEEPYSLAILLDRLLPDRSDWDLTILGTDISLDSLTAAERGTYREWSLRATPGWLRARYFRRRSNGTYVLDPAIRRMVDLAPLNLAQANYPADFIPPGGMDLVVCRNVLMYFTQSAARAAAERLKAALADEGWLLTAPAEASAELFRPLTPVNFPGAIFFARTPGASLPSASVQTAVAVPLTPPPPPGRAPVSPAAAAAVLRPTALPRLLPPSERTGRSAVRNATMADAGVAHGVPVGQERQHTRKPDARALLQRARLLANRGDLEAARRACEETLATDLLAVEAHVLHALICQEQGKVTDAREALRRVIYLAPDLALAYFLLGGLFLRLGEDKRGRHCLATVVDLLSPLPRHQPVPGVDGLTVGRLLAAAEGYRERFAG